MEDRHLEEDDEEDQHAHPVDAEDAVEPFGGKQMHGLPARQHDQHRGDGADEQRDDRGDRVSLDQALGSQVDLTSSRLAGAKRSRASGRRLRWDDGGSAHCPLLAAAAAGASSTMTRPTIMW